MLSKNIECDDVLVTWNRYIEWNRRNSIASLFAIILLLFLNASLLVLSVLDEISGGFLFIIADLYRKYTSLIVVFSFALFFYFIGFNNMIYRHRFVQRCPFCKKLWDCANGSDRKDIRKSVDEGRCANCGALLRSHGGDAYKQESLREFSGRQG